METKSSIIAIGLSVHHTPVEIREKLSIPQVCKNGCALLFYYWISYGLCRKLFLPQGENLGYGTHVSAVCRLNGLVRLRS